MFNRLKKLLNALFKRRKRKNTTFRKKRTDSVRLTGQPVRRASESPVSVERKSLTDRVESTVIEDTPNADDQLNNDAQKPETSVNNRDSEIDLRPSSAEESDHDHLGETVDQPQGDSAEVSEEKEIQIITEDIAEEAAAEAIEEISRADDDILDAKLDDATAADSNLSAENTSQNEYEENQNSPDCPSDAEESETNPVDSEADDDEFEDDAEDVTASAEETKSDVNDVPAKKSKNRKKSGTRRNKKEKIITLQDLPAAFNEPDHVIEEADLDVSYSEVKFDVGDLNSIIDFLTDKIVSNKLIGYDLLQIASDKKTKNKIHRQAEKYLIQYYDQVSPTFAKRNIIVISLIIIALDFYDGSYWEHVEDTYKKLYSTRSTQKINGMLRQVLNYYSEGEKRYINFVIRHSIIPRSYVPDFISFAFDIYKNVLHAELPADLGQVLASVFKGISANYDTFTSERYAAKTYKLIKTTKSIIDNITWFPELIAYTSIILRYIDMHYWNDRSVHLPYSDYFDVFFNDWISRNKEIFFPEKGGNDNREPIWKASYKLQNNKIILKIPNIMLRNDVNPKKISVRVYNDSELLKTYDNPVIIKTMGGYQIQSFETVISKPIGMVRYEVKDDVGVIADSGAALYREYFVFNDSHRELRKNSVYTGEIDIVAKDLTQVDGVEIYAVLSDYMIGSYYLEEYESLKIGNETVYYSEINEQAIKGEMIPNVQIKSANHTFPVYSSVNELIYSSDKPAGTVYMQANGVNYKLDAFVVAETQNKTIYRIDLHGVIINGFNHIRLIDRQDDRKVFSEVIFVDPDYACVFTPTQNDEVAMHLKSVFISDLEMISGMQGDKLFDIEFTDSHFESKLHLIPALTVPVYRIENGRWHLFKTPLFSRDAGVYSKLYLDGINADTAALVNIKSQEPYDLPIHKNDESAYIGLDKIKQFESSESSMMPLMFYKDGLIVDAVPVYLRVVIDDRDPNIIKYDESRKQVIIEFDYYGHDLINVTVSHNNKTIFEHITTDKPVHIVVDNIKPFVPYQVRITAGEDDMFSLGVGSYVIYEKQTRFYSEKGIIGKRFQVSEANTEFYNRRTEDFEEKSHRFRDTTVTIKESLDDETYNAVIEFNRERQYQMAEVDLVVTSTISNGHFWCAISQEGDLMLFDGFRDTIVFDESNPIYKNNHPITEYRLEYLSSDERFIKSINSY